MKNLKKYKWKLRILLISTPNYKDKKYIETKEIYNKHIKEFHKKYLKLITETNKPFSIKLIGFDGSVKHTYTKLNPKIVLKHISDMPMGNFTPTKLSLFADYNPSTTIKGLGYKDKEKAEYTIKKIKNKSLKYQKSVVSTMLGRAKSHPNQTKGMRDAIKIFEKWLKEKK